MCTVRKITVATRFKLIPVRRSIMSVCRPVGKEVVVIMKSKCRYKSYIKDRKTRLHKFNGMCQVHESELSGLFCRETIRPWTRRLPYKPTEEERMSHSVSNSVFRAGCAHHVKGLVRDWPHHYDSGLTPAIHMVARDFCVTNTKYDDALTILVMKEKSYQSAGVTVMHDMSAIEFAMTTGAGYLNFWEYHEVMITCDQEQSMRRIAELFQERRRSRRTIVNCSPKGTNRSRGVVDNVHLHLKALLRTKRFDPIDKTAASVNVKTLLEPCLVKHFAWSLTRFVIDFARLSIFKRLCGKCYVGESLGETSCSRRKADGMILGKLDLSDETIVGVGQMRTTTDIMCYSGAISACEKGENLGSSPVPSKKTNMCSIPGNRSC